MTRRGLFITFEGADGSGKTTQMHRLITRIRRDGLKVLVTAEPGGTPIGVRIRDILLDNAHREMHPTTEMLLYFASRAQNVHQWIMPALASGHVIVCDRFTDSTLVYQGAARGLGEEQVRAMHRFACGPLWPDLTVYLDLDIETGLARTHRRGKDRMESQSADFHQRVRDAYLRLAAAEPARFRVIDGRPHQDVVEQAVWSAVAPSLEALRV